MKKRLLVVPVALALVLLFATSPIALASPFLCPAVNNKGLTNADEKNGDNGVSTIGPIGSGDQSFNPGKNQAGANANDNAINPEGPGTSPGPGNGNSDWSPIWPG